MHRTGILSFAVVAAALFAACDRHDHAAPADHDHAAAADHHEHVATAEHHDHDTAAALPSVPPASSAMKPIQVEMRLLEEATREAVTAVSYGQLEGIAPALHRVHQAKEATEASFEKGYTTPKNGADVEGFKKRDEAFHGELVKLIGAAKTKDPKATTKQLEVVLDGCADCHATYRW